MKRFLSCALAIILILSLCSCGKNNDVNIYFPIENDVHSLDPQIVSDDAGIMIALNVYECLVRIDSDGNIVPGAAESWEISADGLVYTFTISDNAKWYITDTARSALGEKLPQDISNIVTASDFVYGLQRAVSPEINAPEREILNGIKYAREILDGEIGVSALGVKAISDKKLQITLNSADENFLRVLARPICAPCNEAFYNATEGRYGVEMKYICSNGAYFVTRKNAGSYIRISKSDEYIGMATALYDAVWFYINTDIEKIPDKISSGIYEAGYVDYDYASEFGRKYTSTVTDCGVNCFIFNAQDKYMANLTLRKAFCSCLSDERLTEIYGTTTNSFISPSVSNLICSISFPDTNTYNKENAHSLLFDALKALNLDSIQLTCLCLSSDEKNLSTVIQDVLEALGTTCGISIETVSKSALYSRLSSGDYEIAFVPFEPDTADEYEIFTEIGSFANIAYTGFTQTVEKMKSADANALTTLCEKAADYLINKNYVYPVTAEKKVLVKSKSATEIYNCSDIAMTYFSK